MIEDSLDDIMARCLGGAGSPTDMRQLGERLTEDAALRRSWLRLARMDALLHRRALRQPTATLPIESAAALGRLRLACPRVGRQVWESFTTPICLGLGIAGILIGMLGASVVWAMVPSHGGVAQSVVRLLTDGFETGLPRQAAGWPKAMGVWGGDQIEIVTSGESVRPRSGLRMLRFVDGAREGQDGSRGASCDVVKLIDLRPYRHLVADGGWGVRVTTHCNASQGSSRGHDEFAVAAIAFRSPGEAVTWEPEMLQEKALAYAWCRRIMLDDDPATWQPATTELLLPSTAECLAVHVSVSEYSRAVTLPRKTFGCHYCDDVVVTLVRRP
jgi:hypothetical protein